MADYENMTAQELTVSKGATPAVQKIVDLWTRSIFGASSANVSAIHFLTHCKSCDGLINAVDVLAAVGQNLHTEDAAHKICQQLAGYLQQSSIQTRQQVVQIEQVADNNCVVTTHTGNVYECAKVILAGSSAMCKNITIFPALSQEKSWVQTAEEHGFRTTVQVLFDHPWWQERNFSGFAQGIDGPIVQVTPANSGIHGLYALTCAIAGEDARSMWTWSMGDDEREDAICTHLRSIFGGNIPRPVLVVEQQVNALVAGEQSLNVPFANMLDMSVDQWKSEGNIHFSGADTSFVWRGHIEGALNAGDRAASEVVTALGGEVAVELGARL
jgi:monoamine oxidase